MKTTGPHGDTDHFLVLYIVLFYCYVVKFIPIIMFTADFDFGTFLGKDTFTTLALYRGGQMGANEPIVASTRISCGSWLNSLTSSQYNGGLSLDHASEWLSL